ncbi:head-tail connector protein [Microlunatus parietis]|uniref:Phage gp6-like head-tail connector protein n=1 Tax=Microlunatus parietis TaxID=682979 RepID=A0A7Y9LAM3_9ACTN|nr:head-tail connector protein [Microlunatus parietis]NYE68866.1 hypothetical protein [Microlunatus parietis]
MAARPDITAYEQVKASVAPSADDAILKPLWEAAEDYVWQRIRAWYVPDAEGNPPDPVPPAPASLGQAVRQLTARYFARRNSPDGFLGMGEFGPARVPTVDRDVESLIGPYRPVVFG